MFHKISCFDLFVSCCFSAASSLDNFEQLHVRLIFIVRVNKANEKII